MKLKVTIFYLYTLVTALGCAGASSSIEPLEIVVLEQTKLPFVSELTALEINTIKGAKNKSSNAILLDLALAMGGSARVPEAAAPLKAKYDAFIKHAKKATSDQKDPKKLGLTLFNAFHAELLGFSKEDTELANYEMNQTTVDGILRNGKYNCLSSSIMFGLIANKFGFEVEGVRVPSHVFLELKHSSSGVRIEVETTSSMGFDLKHDKAFFKAQARDWAAKRGLRATTYAEYKNREKVSLKDLILSMHNVQHTHKGKMATKDRMRLSEIGGYLSDKREHQRSRLAVWSNVLTGLVAEKQFDDAFKLDRIVLKELMRQSKRFIKDAEIKKIVIAALDMGSVAMSNLGKHKKAMERQEQIDDMFDIKNLRQNRVYIFQNAAVPMFDQDAWSKAIDIYTACHKNLTDIPNNSCRDNMQFAYLNWSSELEVAENLTKAKSVLKKCISKNSLYEQCRQRLTELEN